MSDFYKGLDLTLDGLENETEAEKADKKLNVVVDTVLHNLKLLYVVCRNEQELIVSIQDELDGSIVGDDSDHAMHIMLEELMLANIDITEAIVQIAGYVEAKKTVQFYDGTGMKMKKGVH